MFQAQVASPLPVDRGGPMVNWGRSLAKEGMEEGNCFWRLFRERFAKVPLRVEIPNVFAELSCVVTPKRLIRSHRSVRRESNLMCPQHVFEGDGARNFLGAKKACTKIFPVFIFLHFRMDMAWRKNLRHRLHDCLHDLIVFARGRW